jgi:hypothetical protein
MPHICDEPNCTNKVWGNGKCYFHRWKAERKTPVESSRSILQPLSPRKGKIPRRTKERAKNEDIYNIESHKFFDEAVINGTNICVFCGQKVTKFEGVHHWKGRKNGYLLDKAWWSLVHNDHHLMYHDLPIEKLEKETWYKSFLDRLREFNLSLWEKQVDKKQKSGKINLELFGD